MPSRRYPASTVNRITMAWKTPIPALTWLRVIAAPPCTVACCPVAWAATLGAGGWKGGLWSGEVEAALEYPIWEVIRWQSADQMRHLKTLVLSAGRRYQDLVPSLDLVSPNRSGRQSRSTAGRTVPRRRTAIC